MSDLDLFAIGGFTLDDVVLPDGTCDRQIPGGNALYSALGAHLWRRQGVAPVSWYGSDYPSAHLGQLSEAGIDVSFLSRAETPSVHLWVLYEPNGKRQIHYQHGSGRLTELDAAVRRATPALSPHLADGASVHVAALPVGLQREIRTRLGQMPGHVTLDSIEAVGSVGGDLASYWEGSVLDGITAFLPSQDEFDVIRGQQSVTEAARRLIERGVSHVVVKRGDSGVDLYDPAVSSWHHLPAYPTHAVDPTGAGDAFCGGFSAGLLETDDVVESILRGAVSASFAVEAVGGLHMLEVSVDRAHRRLSELRGEVTAHG
jgi:ribokinase